MIAAMILCAARLADSNSGVALSGFQAYLPLHVDGDEEARFRIEDDHATHTHSGGERSTVGDSSERVAWELTFRLNPGATRGRRP
jgi:hypothetical protein